MGGNCMHRSRPRPILECWVAQSIATLGTLRNTRCSGGCVARPRGDSMSRYISTESWAMDPARGASWKPRTYTVAGVNALPRAAHVLHRQTGSPVKYPRERLAVGRTYERAILPGQGGLEPLFSSAYSSHPCTKSRVFQLHILNRGTEA